QQQPVADVVLAAAEGGAADRPAQPLRRQPRAEGARMVRALDRLEYFHRHRLLRGRIAPWHVQSRRRALHRHGGAALARQGGPPSGDVGVRAVAGFHVRLHAPGAHAASRAKGGTSTGLRQFSRLLTKMSYASATAWSGMRWVMTARGEMCPARMCSISRGRWRFTLAWFMRRVRPLFTALPIGIMLKVGPYTPTIEMRPPLRALLMAQCSAIGEPVCSISSLPVLQDMVLPLVSELNASMHTSAPSQSVIF